jgi:RHS repeat-associated protein
LQAQGWINSANNRLVNRGLNIGYDAAGNLQTIGAYSGTFDAENRQVQATQGATTSYVYDGEGRRVQKVQGSLTTNYVYDALGELAAEYSTTPATSDCGTPTCYYSVDHLGSTRLVTDTSGNAQKRFDYLPFGEEIYAGIDGRIAGMGYQSGPDPLNPKFTGKERDLETGLDYFLARYYSGAQGRFTSPDPHSATLLHVLSPQRWNRYSYAIGDPLSFSDPTGKDAVAVNFSGMVGGYGHEGILSIHQDGRATYAELDQGTALGFMHPGLDEPGFVKVVAPNDLPTVQFGADNLPTAASMHELQNELARVVGGVDPSTVRFSYFKTSEEETNLLDNWFSFGHGYPGRYMFLARNCANFSAQSLLLAGAIKPTTYNQLGNGGILSPNEMYTQLYSVSEGIPDVTETITYNLPEDPEYQGE